MLHIKIKVPIIVFYWHPYEAIVPITVTTKINCNAFISSKWHSCTTGHAFSPRTQGVFVLCLLVWIMSRCIKWQGLDSLITTGSRLLERMCLSTPHFTDADYVQDAVLGEGHWETGCCHRGRLIAKHVPNIHSLLVQGTLLLPLVFLREIRESLKEKKAKWSTFRSPGAWVRLVELNCSITDHGGWRGFISQRYVVSTWPVWPGGRLPPVYGDSVLSQLVTTGGHIDREQKVIACASARTF